MQDPLIGQQIEGYIIRNLVGSGGMAQVYCAYDTRLDREVALKILATSMHRQPAFAERFLHEGRTLAQFNHPTIVPIYTVGHHQGRPYLVQELLAGPTLESELAAAPRPTPAAIQAIIDDVADALDYAHARGVIHRDLKPGNLMRNRYGQLVLMDFGIAKAVTGTEKLTQTGMVLGTPHYLAPEQARGGTLTPAVDIYALGVILFELLTGQVPFDDPSPLVVAIAHLSEPPPAPRTLRPDLPLAVEAVVLQALAKAPEARFNHAGVLATALRSAWDAVDIATMPPSRYRSVASVSMPHGRSPIRPPITPAPGAMQHQIPTTQSETLHTADAPPAAAPAVRIPGPPITLPAWLRHPAWRTDRRLHVILGVGMLLILLVVLIRRDPAIPSMPPAASGATTAQGSVSAPVAELAGPIIIADALTAAPWHTQQESRGSMVYVGSRYQLHIPPGTNTFWSLAPHAVAIPTADSVLTVMVTPNQGKAGLVFGFRSLQDHYRLVTQADGTFFLEQRQGAAITTIASGSGAGAGRLGLVLRGTTVRAYFDDTLLHELTLDAPLQGSVGVILVTPDAGDAIFETLTVRSAP